MSYLKDVTNVLSQRCPTHLKDADRYLISKDVQRCLYQAISGWKIMPRTPIASAASVNFGIGLTMVLVGCVMIGIAAALLCLNKPILYAKDGRYDQLLMSVMPVDPKRRWMQMANPK
ncbi:uncharacterized protein CDAR_589801 [Caerostris darwini]|uniref:Uncharacterized protein n=1 Tax=Caerostris darwini TaxID=1538125 RepID=A0AAV4PJ03_9ARAC|nr:uncharacterized protein CDAR_589801 [Caerostris darwini]